MRTLVRLGLRQHTCWRLTSSMSLLCSSPRSSIHIPNISGSPPCGPHAGCNSVKRSRPGFEVASDRKHQAGGAANRTGRKRYDCKEGTRQSNTFGLRSVAVTSTSPDSLTSRNSNQHSTCIPPLNTPLSASTPFVDRRGADASLTTEY